MCFINLISKLYLYSLTKLNLYYQHGANKNYSQDILCCFLGEGNGNPFQCSCLENPRDGGAWWAVISGVAQSRTWLKRLSSNLAACCFLTESLKRCVYFLYSMHFTLDWPHFKYLLAALWDNTVTDYSTWLLQDTY